MIKTTRQFSQIKFHPTTICPSFFSFSYFFSYNLPASSFIRFLRIFMKDTIQILSPIFCPSCILIRIQCTKILYFCALKKEWNHWILQRSLNGECQTQNLFQIFLFKDAFWELYEFLQTIPIWMGKSHTLDWIRRDRVRLHLTQLFLA